MKMVAVIDNVVGAGVFKGVTQFVRENPLVAIGGTGVAVASVTAGVVAARRRKTKKKKASSRKTTTRKKPKRRKGTKRRKTKRIRKTPHTAGKGKDRSTRRIRHTKKGQPYVILASGKARFIKKSSARRSRKLKGGRY